MLQEEAIELELIFSDVSLQLAMTAMLENTEGEEEHPF